jgi:hypothetical protein
MLSSAVSFVHRVSRKSNTVRSTVRSPVDLTTIRTLSLINTSSSSFEYIIQSDMIYVDKTKHIYDVLLAKKQKFHFIVRPRRFGKSLTCSTLSWMFKGERGKKVFKGMEILKLNWNFEEEQSPVLHLDMSTISNASKRITIEQFKIDLRNYLMMTLKHIGKELLLSRSSSQKILENLSKNPLSAFNIYDIESIHNTTSNSALFREILSLLHEAYQKKVVIIIDEYDKPILEHIGHDDIQMEIQQELSSVYSVLKSREEDIRLVFITGMYKFSQTSMFSSLNNLFDHTFSLEAGCLFGYTESEILSYYPHQLEALKISMGLDSIKDVIKRLKDEFNGYSFGYNSMTRKISVRVFNPYSTNLTLDTLQFKDFWGLSGSASLLVDKLYADGMCNKAGLGLAINKSLSTHASELESSTTSNEMNTTTLMYYGGYSTIESIDEDNNLMLVIPNASTRMTLYNGTLRKLFTGNNDWNAEIINNMKALCLFLESDDLTSKVAAKRLVDISVKLFKHFPYDKVRYEESMRSLFDLSFKLRFKCAFENHESKGRSDAVIEMDHRIVVVEYKLNGSSQLAFNQIREKKYYRKYISENKPVICMGIGNAKKLWSFTIGIAQGDELLQTSTYDEKE